MIDQLAGLSDLARVLPPHSRPKTIAAPCCAWGSILYHVSGIGGDPSAICRWFRCDFHTSCFHVAARTSRQRRISSASCPRVGCGVRHSRRSSPLCCPDPHCQPHCCCARQGSCDHAFELATGVLTLRGVPAFLRAARSSGVPASPRFAAGCAVARHDDPRSIKCTIIQ